MEIITTSLEHESILQFIENENNGNIKLIGPDENGQITAKSIINQINDKTGLISIIHSNEYIGIVNNIEQIFKGVKSR